MFNIATTGIGIHLLKRKVIYRKIRTVAPLGKADLQPFMNARLWVKKLVRESQLEPEDQIRNNDQVMEEKQEEEIE